MESAIPRERMVTEQVTRRGVRDARVLRAMGKVPRHRFVDEALSGRAYGDYPLPIGERQTISLNGKTLPSGISHRKCHRATDNTHDRNRCLPEQKAGPGSPAYFHPALELSCHFSSLSPENGVVSKMIPEKERYEERPIKAIDCQETKGSLYAYQHFLSILDS